MQLKTQTSHHNYKNFVDFLADNNKIKPGFRQILKGRDLLEVDRYINEKRLLAPDQLQHEYANFFGLEFEHLLNKPIRQEIARLIPEDVARKYKVVALSLEGNTLKLAVGEPALLQRTAPQALLNLKRQKGLRVELIVVPEPEVMAAVKKLYSNPVPTRTPVTPPAHAAKAEQTSPLPVSKPAVNVPPVPPVVIPKQPMATNKQDLIKEVEPRQVVDLSTKEIKPDVLTKIPYSVAKKYKIIVFNSKLPVSEFEQPLIEVALVHPADIHVLEILSFIEQRNKVLIKRYETTEESFQQAISKYPEASATAPKTAEPPAEKPAIRPPEIDKPVSVADNELKQAPKVDEPRPIQSKSEDELVDPRKLPREAFPIVAKQPKVAPDTMVSEGPSPVVDSKDLKGSPQTANRTEEQRAITDEDQNLDSVLKTPISSAEDLSEIFKKAFIPEIVAATLFYAIKMKASDVHIEAGQDHARVRFRIDGVLHDIIKVPISLHAPVISRIKILAKMKIDEQRVPQDGRFDVTIDNRQVDLRVSTLPTVHGEKVVMRLLDKSQGIMTLEQLGVTGSNFDTLIANINKPYGVILSTGPTGSGKSTTLYAILSRISKPGVNIITLEDPVEYELPGINQAQVKPGIGFTFADGLRSVLRQDPNVIMVGEIRDLETAAMATHAALTGHLVLSTLHTNDASGALPRLINMGVEPFLITSSLNAVIGQRLVRKVCDNCREKISLPPAVNHFVMEQLSQAPAGQLKDLNLEELTFYHGKGCSQCTNGYRGRIGIFEVLPMRESIEELAVKKAPSSEIKRAAIELGMITMTQDGLIKALKGITTVDEVMRVTTADSKEVPGG